MTTTEIWQNQLRAVANPDKVKILSSFFKTGKGEYGEGDIFIGVTVPLNRTIARNYISAPFSVYTLMLSSQVHEFRLAALLALVLRFKKCKDYASRSEIVHFYLSHTAHINNWDLVDQSCPYILGEWTLSHGDQCLHTLSHSTNMWEQRIAIVSTLTHIRNGHFHTALTLAERFLPHTHDLMHKATGWMLREVGKRNADALHAFLRLHTPHMARTTLRYAIERLSPTLRSHYLSIKKV